MFNYQIKYLLNKANRCNDLFYQTGQSKYAVLAKEAMDYAEQMLIIQAKAAAAEEKIEDA